MSPTVTTKSPLASLTAALGPTVHVQTRDTVRRLQLECVLDRADPGRADVVVIELDANEKLPRYDVPVLVLTDDPAHAANPEFAGVLARMASVRQVSAAVAALAEGLTVRTGATRFPAAAAPGVLTPREIDVLGRIAEGMSNKSIARDLGISAHTVKYHLEAVFAKLAVRSRAEAVTQCLKRGLVRL